MVVRGLTHDRGDEPAVLCLEDADGRLRLGLLIPLNEANRLARALGQTPCPCVPVFELVERLVRGLGARGTGTSWTTTAASRAGSASPAEPARSPSPATRPMRWRWPPAPAGRSPRPRGRPGPPTRWNRRRPRPASPTSGAGWSN